MSPENAHKSSQLFNDQESLTVVQDIPHNYAFIFSQIIQLYKLYYPESNGLSSKADEVKLRFQALKKDNKISDCLFENFLSVMRQYPTMLPSKLIEEKNNVGYKRQLERLLNLKKILNLFIGDLAEEISDVVKMSDDYEKRMLFLKYFQ